MTLHNLIPLLVFFVTMIASVLSGMAGGGGGFIITPFYILIGLTPQQTIATGKFGSFGLSTGAIAAFREKILDNKKFSIFVMILATICGAGASLLLRSIDNQSLQFAMGILMLAMVPFMVFKDSGLNKSVASTAGRIFGSLALVVVLLLQGVLSGGIGSLVSPIFIVFFGMTVLQANIMKRKASILLNGVVVAALLGSGLINFTYGLCGVAGGLVGGYIGSSITIRKGENFARWALILFMVISGLWLVLSK